MRVIEWTQHAARELHTWSKCRHPNVVELLGLAEFRGQIGMVSFWMENGNLPSYLARHHDADRCQLVRYQYIRFICADLGIPPIQSLQISEGLAYLHGRNIVRNSHIIAPVIDFDLQVHGDLKGVGF